MSIVSVDNKKFLESLKDFELGWSKISEKFLEEQRSQLENFLDFASRYENIFDRNLSVGHITASGFVVSEDFSHLLMTYHRKLDKWLQLGGHCDNDPDVFSVAIKECQEESGLQNFLSYPFKKYFSLPTEQPLIFDLDRHMIPKYKNVESHYHYDVRYLLTADHKQKLTISHESKDLQWIPIDEVLKYNLELSIERPLRKIKYLKDLKDS